MEGGGREGEDNEGMLVVFTTPHATLVTQIVYFVFLHVLYYVVPVVFCPIPVVVVVCGKGRGATTFFFMLSSL